jgi:hypothetical protein
MSTSLLIVRCPVDETLGRRGPTCRPGAEQRPHREPAEGVDDRDQPKEAEHGGQPGPVGHHALGQERGRR